MDSNTAVPAATPATVNVNSPSDPPTTALLASAYLSGDIGKLDVTPVDGRPTL
jgi:hypothetical protein